LIEVVEVIEENRRECFCIYVVLFADYDHDA